MKGSKDRRGRWAYAVMCVLSAAGFFLPWLYEAMGREGLALLGLHPYLAVLPLCLAGPFLCSLWGVPPLISFFPPGLAYLLCPAFPGRAGEALLFLLLSLAAAEAGWETAKRRQNHGKGSRKRNGTRR